MVTTRFIGPAGRLTLVLLALTAASFAAGGDVATGLAAYERGDYQTALREWRSAAERGDALAQFNLGFMYASGRGIEVDHAEAARWHRLAAEQGLAQSQQALAKMYAAGVGVPASAGDAFGWYRRAAEAGLVESQYHLAAAYRSGNGCAQSLDEALRWYRKAAEQGHRYAQVALHEVLRRRGDATAEDLTEAARWLREAAAGGLVSAQHELGLWLLGGDGIPRDTERAEHWLRSAAEAEFTPAQYELGRIYWNGDGVPFDADEADRWLGLAVARGFPAAREMEPARNGLREFHLRNGRFMDWPTGRPVVVRTPDEILRGPASPVTLGSADTVQCDFFPRRNQGGNPKFRCFMMTAPKSEDGSYYDVFGNVQPQATEVVFVADGRRRVPLLARDGTPLTYRTAFRSHPLPPLELKVKYRPRDDPDPVLERYMDMYSEVAATRLLWSLHYAVDRMYRVDRVVCHRCPPDPFRATEPAGEGTYESFDDVAIELRYGGESVERAEQTYDGGWSWGDEIWRLRYGRGVDGFSEARQARFDGLVVLLNLIRHVSSQPHQNRLVCSRQRMQPVGDWKFCMDTVLLVHDLGSVFGKKRVNSLETWRGFPMWKDSATCEPALIFKTGRLESPRTYRIGRAGQQFILGALDQLTDEHLLALFEAAAFDRFDLTLVEPGERPGPERSREILEAWIRAFRAKVEEIRGVDCPEQ